MGEASDVGVVSASESPNPSAVSLCAEVDGGEQRDSRGMVDST